MTSKAPVFNTGDGTRPTALITGGTRGIGRALATAFAEYGFDLVLVARSRTPLEQHAASLEASHGIDVLPLQADLTDPSAPDRLVETLADRRWPIDVLVNNAGMATYGPFAQADPTAERDLLRLNVEAPVALTRAFLPAMLERDAGIVGFVTSTAAFRPGPMMASYHASKAHLRSFTESLAGECAGTGVSVTALCPGPVSTPIHDECGRGTTWLERRFMLSPETVAARGVEGMLAGEPVVIPGWRNRVIPSLARILPSRARQRLGAWVTSPGVLRRP